MSIQSTLLTSCFCAAVLGVSGAVFYGSYLDNQAEKACDDFYKANREIVESGAFDMAGRYRFMHPETSKTCYVTRKFDR